LLDAFEALFEVGFGWTVAGEDFAEEGLEVSQLEEGADGFVVQSSFFGEDVVE
jgi:hypothetical protein